MVGSEQDSHGLAMLRLALWQTLNPTLDVLVPAVAGLGPAASGSPAADRSARLLTETVHAGLAEDPSGRSHRGSGTRGSESGEPEATRLTALVELARGGDAEAFGLLYDHYHPSIYRFVYYRVGSVAVAEDLTSDTFFRALRSIGSFRWQGKDFGAWLTTIARNLTTDHFKAGRTRLEQPTEDMTPHDRVTEGPETTVLASLTNEALLTALRKLPHEQQECLVMRFLQGLSIAETATVLGRSDGAVKQLQLRAVRSLAKLLPDGLG